MTTRSSRAENLRGLWGLDFARLNVNHGSYGAAPLSVLAEQSRWRERMEAGATYFIADELPQAIRAAAAALAEFVGAERDDLVFVDNATAGINAILESMQLAPGDEILMHSQIYGAVLKTAHHVAGRTSAVLTSAELPFPDPTREGIVAAFAAAITPRTRIVIIDHIVSPSALILPVAEIAALAKAAGALALVDGAHGPANVPIDLKTLGVDFYVGNCHKWLMAPKGAGFLWSAPAHQPWLHPNIISHGYLAGFLAEFDWTGTRDWSAALAVPAAIAFHRELGGPALMAANRDLAWEAAGLLSAHWDTPIAAAPDFFGAMALIGAPITGDTSPERIHDLRRRLRLRGADAPIMEVGDRLWIRISAQAYNRIEDYEKLAGLVAALEKE
ncbi:MAG: aminotransferase class V-fold PLP-dependent enzyme [Hyphomicrobiales bacterium]|nr:MAG: aminotransferase class V-fold PLP-dependent enzyme [Hyphomicrobiales bacterium]